MSLSSSLPLPLPMASSTEGRRVRPPSLQSIVNQFGGWEKRGLRARARFPVVLSCGSSTFIILLFLADTVDFSCYVWCFYCVSSSCESDHYVCRRHYCLPRRGSAVAAGGGLDCRAVAVMALLLLAVSLISKGKKVRGRVVRSVCME